MSFKITYDRVHLLFAIATGINVFNMLVSRLIWPSLPAFPELFSGHLVLSLAVYAVLITVGMLVRRRLHGKISMAVYAQHSD